MLDIRINQNSENCTITLDGHAGYAPMGQDIVCAGISSIYQTMVSAIDLFTEAMPREYPSDNSVMCCICGLDEKAELYIEAFRLGCKAISDAYPENVKVKDV